MPTALEYNATLVERVDLEPSLAVFRVRADAGLLPPRPWFVPGQYVTLGLNRGTTEPSDPRPPSVRRPMSIASAPEDDDLIEFYIRRVANPTSDLPLTHLLWPLHPGDRVYVRMAPTGKFTLRDTVGEDDTRLKVCVAAGTGLAPFICMARSRLKDGSGRRLDDLAILHGASLPSGLGYRDELLGMRAQHGLGYVPTVSRPHETTDWEGATGRVEALFSADALQTTESELGLPRGGLRPDRAVVLICGLQGTIANTIVSLLARGFTPDHRRLRRALEIDDGVPPTLFWEQYDTEPVLDVKDEAWMAELRQRYQAATHG